MQWYPEKKKINCCFRSFSTDVHQKVSRAEVAQVLAALNVHSARQEAVVTDIENLFRTV